MPDSSTNTTPAAQLTQAIARARASRGVALIAYLTAGFPDRHAFPDLLRGVAQQADVIEVGVPFSDPMADGVTIQDASRQALADGVTLKWILDTLQAIAHSDQPITTPIVLMSYLNPVLRFGFDQLAARAAAAGVRGVILPDLPFDEAETLAAPLRDAGLAIVQMATPVTTDDRLDAIINASTGFLYAVTTTGTTGKGSLDASGAAAYLDHLRQHASAHDPAAPLPICAGFGIRNPDHVRALAPHADGVIVGSALIEAIANNQDPGAFLAHLRP